MWHHIYGHLVCQVDDVDGVKKLLLNIISNLDKINKNISECDYTTEVAVSRMLLLFDNLNINYVACFNQNYLSTLI